MARTPQVEVRSLVLVVTRAGETSEFEFKQPSILIGSGPTANVVLEGSDVSTIHAIIKVTLESATLIDLGSDTGTKLNGVETREKKLKHGDVIGIGKAQLKVELPAVLSDENTAPGAVPEEDAKTV